MDITIRETTNVNSCLQFSKISVDEAYCKKWRIHLNDFICLTKDGKLISNFLYRIGGLNNPNPERDNYFMLLKHVEAHYPDSITLDKENKPHLESRWVIIDKNGTEKVEFEAFKSPYLTRYSCIYSVDTKYYNIETGECYGSASRAIQSDDFLFLDNQFDRDPERRGVMKIDKKIGKWELFKLKNK